MISLYKALSEADGLVVSQSNHSIMWEKQQTWSHADLSEMIVKEAKLWLNFPFIYIPLIITASLQPRNDRHEVSVHMSSHMAYKTQAGQIKQDKNIRKCWVWLGLIVSLYKVRSWCGADLSRSHLLLSKHSQHGQEQHVSQPSKEQEVEESTAKTNLMGGETEETMCVNAFKRERTRPGMRTGEK